MRHLHGFHAANHGSPHPLASQCSLFTKQPEENDQLSVWQEKTHVHLLQTGQAFDGYTIH